MIRYEFLKVTPTYTGGGIYVIDGALKNGLFFMACPSDGFTEILDADGSEKDNNGDQVMYDSEWIELHRVNTLVDKTDNDSFMCELCKWIILKNPDGNYTLSDIKKIYSDYLDSKKTEKYANIEYEEIDICGSVDALMDWWMSKGMTDKQYYRDDDEVPCNASNICIALGEIASRATRCKCNTTFFVSTEFNEGDIYWVVSDTLKIGADTDEIYKIKIEDDVIYFYQVLLIKTEIIEHYCEESDTTFITECNYVDNLPRSQKVIGFYHGCPIPELTSRCVKEGKLVAEYTL